MENGAETPGNPNEWEDELIVSITPDVMECLAKCKFFAELDNQLCPADGTNARQHCRGNYEISESILRSHGFDETEMPDVFNVLRAQGGCCDCEVLFNVAGESRLKAEYWRARAAGQKPRVTHDSVN